MNTLIWAFVIIGAIAVGATIVWPILEAVIFGHMDTLLTLLSTDWTFGIDWKKPITYWWLITFLVCNPWKSAWARVGGDRIHTSSITQGGWKYTPPFKLRRTKRRK